MTIQSRLFFSFALLALVLTPTAGIRPRAQTVPAVMTGVQPAGEKVPAGLWQEADTGARRLAYTMSFLGIPVARAILDEVRPAEPGGEWIVRGGARTTAVWEQFTHIHNAYVTRLRMPGSVPVVYEREIDEKNLRFRSIERYGGTVSTGGDDEESLPVLPERYVARGRPENIDLENTATGRHNFFSALWWVRYADWDRLTEARLDLQAEGVPWLLTIRREGEETQRAPEGRVATWRIVCTLSRPATGTGDAGESGGGHAGTSSDAGAESGSGTESGHRSDYLTRHLIQEGVELTFWIGQEPARRPIVVRVRLPGFIVRGSLREPFDDEIVAREYPMGNSYR